MVTFVEKRRFLVASATCFLLAELTTYAMLTNREITQLWRRISASIDNGAFWQSAKFPHNNTHLQFYDCKHEFVYSVLRSCLISADFDSGDDEGPVFRRTVMFSALVKFL